jgi:hypothetical protein
MKIFLYPLIVFFCLSQYAFAFKINPLSEFDEENQKYYKTELLFPHPVHENLTVRALNKVPTELIIQPLNELRGQIVEGVRWNDDPLRMLENKLLSFGINYAHSCKDDVSGRIDPNWDYLYRTHCGDMQYLHAMASSKIESKMDTVNKIMMWLEFTYKVSSGVISKDHRLSSVHKAGLSKKSPEIFFEEITNSGDKYKCKENSEGKVQCAEVETLFSFECKRVLDWRYIWLKSKSLCKNKGNIQKKHVQNIALGSAIHLLQDSMSDSHVSRSGQNNKLCSPETSKIGINKFYFYMDQKSSMHSKADKKLCASTQPGVDVHKIVEKFITWSLRDRKEGSESWKVEVEPYLRNTVFSLNEGSNIEPENNKYNKAN